MTEKVRIDGEVEIPKVKWLDWLSRVDKLLELLLKVESNQLQVLKIIAGVPVEIPEIVAKVEIAKANRYETVEIDLGTAHTDEPIGLLPKTRVASALTWEQVEATLTYKLNSKGNKPLSASVGVEHESWEIEEIYYTNAAAAGKKAVLYYEWRQD